MTICILLRLRLCSLSAQASQDSRVSWRRPRLSVSEVLLQNDSGDSDDEGFPIRRMGEHIPMIEAKDGGQSGVATPHDEETLYPTNSAAQLKASPYYAQYTQEFRKPEGSATCCPCGHMEGNNAHLCGSGKLFPFVCEYSACGYCRAMSASLHTPWTGTQASSDQTGRAMHVLGHSCLSLL